MRCAGHNEKTKYKYSKVRPRLIDGKENLFYQVNENLVHLMTMKKMSRYIGTEKHITRKQNF